MISCGVQICLCDYPVHMDTYRGCSHACKYCFVKTKYNISKITAYHMQTELRNFISGKRKADTRWCDWNIPLHWGANSDPFQACEKIHKCSLECLEIFAETGYPFIVSTKNPVMLTEEPYFSLIKKCKCVIQVSMACSKYDKLEQGAPKYEDRLKAVKVLSDCGIRTYIRVRPYFPDAHEEIMREIPRYAEAGAYCAAFGAFFSVVKQQGMVRMNGKYFFTNEFLYLRFLELKHKCHEVGLRFYCTESGLDSLSDDLNCCGTTGLLDDFKPNTYNLTHFAYDDEEPKPTECMKKSNTGQPFKCFGQSQAWALEIKGKSMADLMLYMEEKEHMAEWRREQRILWADSEV